jgi:hypothetical protein
MLMRLIIVALHMLIITQVFFGLVCSDEGRAKNVLRGKRFTRNVFYGSKMDYDEAKEKRL